MDDPLLDAAMYHCQQAAEKAVKVWLQRDDPLPKTHDVDDLVNLAAKFDEKFKELAEMTAVLTPYVSAFRYPGGSDEPMPSREEFDRALRHAETIYAFILGRIPPEAQPT